MGIASGAIIGGIAGGVIGGLGTLAWGLLQPSRHCPECDTALPKFGRKHARPGSGGGWICPGCGCEIDRKGRRVRRGKGRKS